MRRLLLMLPLSLLLLVPGAVAQDAQQPSLADLARQQKAKQKKENPAKVFTNDSLPANDGSVTTGATGSTVPAESSSGSGAPGAGGTAAKPAGPATATNQGKVDPEKVKEAQIRLDRLKTDMTNLEKNYKVLEEKIANTEDPFQRQVYQNSLATRRDRTQAQQDRIAAAQKELDAAKKGEPAAGVSPSAPAAQPAAQPPAAPPAQQ